METLALSFNVFALVAVIAWIIIFVSCLIHNWALDHDLNYLKKMYVRDMARYASTKYWMDVIALFCFVWLLLEGLTT